MFSLFYEVLRLELQILEILSPSGFSMIVDASSLQIFSTYEEYQESETDEKERKSLRLDLAHIITESES